MHAYMYVNMYTYILHTLIPPDVPTNKVSSRLSLFPPPPPPPGLPQDFATYALRQSQDPKTSQDPNTPKTSPDPSEEQISLFATHTITRPKDCHKTRRKISSS